MALVNVNTRFRQLLQFTVQGYISLGTSALCLFCLHVYHSRSFCLLVSVDVFLSGDSYQRRF